ncbi:putative ABC transporter permease protein YtcP [Clostridia bacterium]|nr:putative ABC transporter permease protein YtcP [Clostridia bacterium]
MSLTTLIPILSVILMSLTPVTDLARISSPSLLLIPSYLTLNNYVWLFRGSTRLLDAYGITIARLISGTALCLLLTVITAYPLSKKYLPGRDKIMMLFFFTMLFSGGMIPTYLVVNTLGLTDTFLALILPCALSVYNMILMRTYFQGLPEELDESARIDGASDMTILFRIILPVSAPALASIGLFYAVMHWNSFMDAVLYIRPRELWPLQLLMREILSTNSAQELSLGGLVEDPLRPSTTLIINVVIVVSALPIMCVYPFIQKYFVKGLMVGAIKG